MAHKKFILIAVLMLVVLSLAGCGESSRRTASAHRRWQRVMEQAQMEAVQEGIEQGRLEYAIRLLENLIESDSAFAEEARQILAELKTARQEIAQARTVAVDTKL